MKMGDKINTGLALLVMCLVLGMAAVLISMGLGINLMRLYEWAVTK